MKKVIIIAVLFIVATGTQAQVEIKNIGLSFGKDKDVQSRLTPQAIMGKSTTGLPSEITQYFDGIGHTQVNSFADVPNIKFAMTLEPSKLKKTEIYTAANLTFNRQEGFEVANSDLGLTLKSNEFNLEAAIVKRKSFIGLLHFYGGLGTNVGYQFGNNILVSGSEIDYTPESSVLRQGNYIDIEDEYTHVNNGISARGFAHLGFGLSLFRIVELGYERRQGYGMRQYFGSEADYAHMSSNRFTVKYIMRKRKKNTVFGLFGDDKKKGKKKKKKGGIFGL